MRILYTTEFKKSFHKLPVGIKKIYQRQESYFLVDWKDHRLHSKKLKGEPITFSFRITLSYRVLFIFLPNEEVLFVSIDHRKDSYR